MIVYVSAALPPPAELDVGFMLGKLDADAVMLAAHVTTDPISGVAIVSLFTDDGRGNGNCVLSLPLAELRDVVKTFNAKL